MHLIKALTLIQLSLTTQYLLTSAASVNCGDRIVSGFQSQELFARKALFDSGSVAPVPLASTINSDAPSGRRFFDKDIQLCIEKTNRIHDTHVLAAELSAFIQMNIECLNRASGTGEVIGDNNVKVMAVLERRREGTQRWGEGVTDSLDEFLLGDLPTPDVVEVGLGFIPA